MESLYLQVLSWLLQSIVDNRKHNERAMKKWDFWRRDNYCPTSKAFRNPDVTKFQLDDFRSYKLQTRGSESIYRKLKVMNYFKVA